MKKVLPDFEFLPFEAPDENSSTAPDKMSVDYELPIVSQTRYDSYRRLMQNPVQRNEFLNLFLTNIFNIESIDKVKSLLAKAIADPRNRTDLDVYQCLAQDLASGDGPANQVSKLWASVQQVRRQREELANETATILYRLGYLGRADGLVSIGDTGKLVRYYDPACRVKLQNNDVDDSMIY